MLGVQRPLTILYLQATISGKFSKWNVWIPNTLPQYFVPLLFLTSVKSFLIRLGAPASSKDLLWHNLPPDFMSQSIIQTSIPPASTGSFSPPILLVKPQGSLRTSTADTTMVSLCPHSHLDSPLLAQQSVSHPAILLQTFFFFSPERVLFLIYKKFKISRVLVQVYKHTRQETRPCL